MSNTSSWMKVVQGLRMVAQASSKIALEEGGHVASAVSRHGIDLAKNARNATSQFAASASATSTSAEIGSRIATSQDLQHYYHLDDKAMGLDKVSDHIDNHQKFESEEKQNTNDTSSDGSFIVKGTTSSNDIEDKVNDKKKKILKEGKPYENHENLEKITLKNDEEGQHQPLHSMYNESFKQNLKEGNAIPSTRVGRALGFASLGVGLAAGTAFEIASRVVSNVTNSSNENKGSVVTNDANSDRLARTLCRMRGAALKLGQMMSIQDETLLAPPLARALEQVRQGADAMPQYQLQAKMDKELGVGWEQTKFLSFEKAPFAAASIGQVHRAVICVKGEEPNQEVEKKVVVKCQYPGVADSIDSDLSNLTMIVKMTGMAPPGLFLDNVIRVGRDELVVECNYLLEAQNQERFRKLVEEDEALSQAKFKVPAVIHELSTQHVLTSEYCPGGTIDKVSFLDQEERNRIGKNILRLTMKELFVWKFMQTDPNWGNFLYDVGTGTTYLIDFGSAREYSKSFVDGYLRIVWANAERDVETLMSQSLEMGFLTGDENEIMMNAHKMSGFTLGEPFATHDVYDFANSGITSRISEYGAPFLQHRLTPPPEEVYTLHRKLAGAYNLCIKLGAKIKCRDLLEDVMKDHVFEDGKDHPMH